jgi:hypothetical protein
MPARCAASRQACQSTFGVIGDKEQLNLAVLGLRRSHIILG